MNWETIDGKLTKDYKFKDFKAAQDFVNKVADLAESANHHQDIKIYSYNKVKIELYSHDQNAITDKDKNLANNIDDLI